MKELMRNTSWTMVALAALLASFVGQALVLPLGLEVIGAEQLPLWFKLATPPLAVMLALIAVVRQSVKPLSLFVISYVVFCLMLGAVVVFLKVEPASGLRHGVAAVLISTSLFAVVREWYIARGASEYETLVADGPYCIWWPR